VTVVVCLVVSVCLSTQPSDHCLYKVSTSRCLVITACECHCGNVFVCDTWAVLWVWREVYCLWDEVCSGCDVDGPTSEYGALRAPCTPRLPSSYVPVGPTPTLSSPAGASNVPSLSNTSLPSSIPTSEVHCCRVFAHCFN